jgi:V-ATPase subunit C
VIPLTPINPCIADADEGICRGNLSVRSLADIVSEDDLLQDSEYMQSILVAIPKYFQCSLERPRIGLMTISQKPRQDLEFQLRTLSHHGGAAVRSVRLLNLFTSTRR